MIFIRGSLGYMIAGIFAMSVWGSLSSSYGILGGYLAAIIIIGPMWFLNHYVGLIKNDEDAAFVDMATGIAICGIMRDIFMKGTSSFSDSLPTLLLVSLGAIIAGITSAAIEKNMAKQHNESKNEILDPNLKEDHIFQLNENPQSGYGKEH
ncbi:hypothetical protein J9303_19325 [Bacillaceae bacterium Marseille-Q3522]|nr:hypothetical protein [Bacillaceae bacterium Marseille-Q3522]